MEEEQTGGLFTYLKKMKGDAIKQMGRERRHGEREREREREKTQAALPLRLIPEKGTQSRANSIVYIANNGDCGFGCQPGRQVSDPQS